MEQSYYYRQMNRDEREAYDAMRVCFESTAVAARVPLLPGSGLGDVFFRLRLDRPELFWVNGCSYRHMPGAEYAELIPDYMFSPREIAAQRKAVEARVAKLIRPWQDLDESGREQAIHDFICTSVRYDKLKKSYSHEIIGPLQNGVGVCEGIAKTVKLLCGRLGIECVIAVSEADAESGYLHAWNVLRIGGRWLHMDATFDNSLSRCGELRYDYYNLPERAVLRDHRPLRYAVPESTDGDAFYYRVQGLSLTREQDVASRAAQALRKKRPAFLFHWRGGYLTRDKLYELVDLITAEASKKGRGAEFGVNYPQAVVRAVFTDGPAPGAEGSAVTAEQADEGESI